MNDRLKQESEEFFDAMETIMQFNSEHSGSRTVDVLFVKKLLYAG